MSKLYISGDKSDSEANSYSDQIGIADLHPKSRRLGQDPWVLIYTIPIGSIKSLQMRATIPTTTADVLGLGRVHLSSLCFGGFDTPEWRRLFVNESHSRS